MLLGGGSDYHAELKRRQAQKEQRMVDKAEVAREKLAQFQDKERVRMQALLELARQHKAPNALFQ